VDEIGCIIALVALILTPISYVINGWVLSLLWRWFLVPFDFPVLSIPQAIGISLVIGFLTHQVPHKHCKDDRSKDDKLTDSIAENAAFLVFPLFALGVGWIVVQFI